MFEKTEVKLRLSSDNSVPMRKQRAYRRKGPDTVHCHFTTLSIFTWSPKSDFSFYLFMYVPYIFLFCQHFQFFLHQIHYFEINIYICISGSEARKIKTKSLNLTCTCFVSHIIRYVYIQLYIILKENVYLERNIWGPWR